MLPGIKGSKPVLRKALTEFIRLESAGGILLLCSALVALVVANSPLSTWYAALLNTPVAILIGDLSIHKPLLLWINDGLMAIFFFLIGLEIKREFVEGELSSPSQIILPALGAAGGMIVPAAVYLGINWGNSAAIDGWAIPVATDIAFALGLLTVFGSRITTSLKVFLLTLAIFDDLAAIIIIAIFYSGDLSIEALYFALGAIVFAIGMNYKGIKRVSAYVLVGIVLWVAVLKSGVHATLAGVIIALCVPMRDRHGGSPLKEMEHDLHGPVAYAILPVFALANAGVALTDVSLSTLIDPVTLGVITGLVVGKPVGILLFVGAAVALGLVRLPAGINWGNITGIAFACGIGFTMSLFIASLAFDHGATDYFGEDRLGILIGSVISAVIAYFLLNWSLPKKAASSVE
jgi:NhaA family Na+:H+ antiporter